MSALTLRTSREFEIVKREGFKSTGKYLITIIRRKVNVTKLGIVVSGKYGEAVARNRTKRQIKEAFREVMATTKEPMEVIAIPKQTAKRAKTADFANDLRDVLLIMQER